MTKEKQLLIRADAGEKAAFIEAAQLAGIPFAVWARQHLRAQSKKELEKAGKKPQFIK